ncbi:MAG: hypothetical protein BWX68_02818 [Verrucomicrobia bacterium ADurb.Bin063]|nr:MAG: hypothetical protein BWX68_02818 [Verrucomicrobia bacterium ADurb.Bin063]
MEQNRVVGGKPPVGRRREVVFHLLQFLGRHRLPLQRREQRVDFLLHLLGAVAVAGLAADVEEAFPFPGNLLGPGLGGPAAAQHQPLVQPAGARGQNLAEDFQRIRIPVPERHGMPQDIHLRIRLGLGVHALFGRLRHFRCDHVRRRPGAARDALEVFAHQRPGRGGREIAHQDECDVLGRIIRGVELIRLRLGNGQQIRGPADHRPGVGRGFPEHGVELLLELAQRRGFDPQPPLFKHHIPLGVKLAENRVEQPLGLHPRPQLQLVGRHDNEIGRQVLGGKGVHPRTALAAIQAVKLVFNQQRALLVHQPAKLLFQLAVAGGAALGLARIRPRALQVGGAHLPLLLPHRLADPLLRGDNLQVARVIRGADRPGALEHHVLEEMRDAGHARPLVRAAHMRHPAPRHRRLVVPRHQQHPHPVGQVLLLHRNLLPRPRQRPRQRQGQNKPGQNPPAARRAAAMCLKLFHARAHNLNGPGPPANSKPRENPPAPRRARRLPRATQPFPTRPGRRAPARPRVLPPGPPQSAGPRAAANLVCRTPPGCV